VLLDLLLRPKLIMRYVGKYTAVILVTTSLAIRILWLPGSCTTVRGPEAYLFRLITII
jgi:hypothetical protein